ncbi:MAG: hypothetical protein H6766_06885 [Candidatus Peribacteria bacterium]|nr:MAG: hypothetical protein H6766_06885 [Candidatus Peribacteria bacterium]
MPITISMEDSVPPYLLESKITIDGEMGAYTIYLPFADDASGIDTVNLSSSAGAIDSTLLE